MQIGADADLVIVDPAREWTVRNEDSFSRAGWTPYAGMKMTGRIEQTVLRGSVVYEKGRVAARPGQGQFVRPSMVS